MKQNIPETSRDAYKSLNPESIRDVYVKIMNALKEMGSGSTEQIANFLGMEHAKIHKRVSEMERMEMIWRPGGKVPTKSGRNAFIWTIRGDHQPKADKEAKAEETWLSKFHEKAVNHYSQTNLF